MPEIKDKESMYDLVLSDMRVAVEVGNAIELHKHVLMEYNEPGVPPGTFAIGFYGKNIKNEDKFHVVFITADGLLDMLDMVTRGVIHERRYGTTKESIN